MSKLINTLLSGDTFEGIRKKNIKNISLSSKEVQHLKIINNDAFSHITGRLTHLASIMVAVQVALNDEELGSFERHHATDIAYFMEEELNTMGAVFSLQNDASYFLQEDGERKQSKIKGENHD